MVNKDTYDRTVGCLRGLAVGDALGAPVEFMPRGTFEPVTGYQVTEKFDLEPGQWTDDTIMALCLAESLIAANGYDSYSVMDEYVAWFKNGKYTPNGYCFDIGNQTVGSLVKYTEVPTVSAHARRGESAGNGTIMRLAPASIVAARMDKDFAENFFKVTARETHFSREAEEATAIFGMLTVNLLNGMEKEEALENIDCGDTYGLVSLLSYVTEDDPVSAGGYVRDALEAAWWAFSTTDSFEECVLKAVNLGDDADTIGAIAGQLAGAYYGDSGIPQNFKDELWKSEIFPALADSLASVEPVILRTRFKEDHDLFQPPS